MRRPGLAATALGVLVLTSDAARGSDAVSLDVLRRLALAPGASGYESPVRAAIRSLLPTWADSVEDNLGNLSVTIGSGKPHRLILAHMDEAGYVVSQIREDGYLRVQRLARVALPPLFDQYHVGQPLVVGSRGGELGGVAVVLSTHLWRAGDAPQGRAARDEDLLIDVGARTAQEAASAGVSILDPVVIRRRIVTLGSSGLAGPALDNRAGCAALVELLGRLEPVKVPGTVTVAFSTQGLADGRGAQRLASRLAPDEVVVVDLPAAHEERSTGPKDAQPASGPAIAAPSATNRLSVDLFGRLAGTARRLSVPVQPMPSSGTAEAAAFSTSTPVALIGAPILYSGSPGQVADARDIAALARLLKAFVEESP